MFACLALFFCGQVSGQDVTHFTLYNFNPLHLNPANTGAFLGTVRVGGIFRDQWFSLNNPGVYVTPSFYVDAPIIRGFRKNDWVGVGGYLFADNAYAGDNIELRTTSFLGSVAYHMGLDKKGNSQLTFAVQAGSIIKSLQGFGFRPEDSFEVTGGMIGSNLGNSLDTRLATISQDQGLDRNVLTINAGVLLSSKINKQSDMRLGMAVKHINTPNQALVGNEQSDSSFYDLPLRFTLHGDFNFVMNKKWSLAPTFLFDRMRAQNELAIQAWLGYLINKDKDITLRFGPGYRLRDAAKILLGVDIKDLRIAVAYDVTLSDLNDSITNPDGNTEAYTGGAFEIGVSKIFKIYKKPQVKPVIFCPRF